MRSLLVDAGRAAIRREAIAFGLLATIVTVAVGIGSLVAVDSNLPSAIDSALSATVARSLSPISGMMVGFLIASIITPIIIVVGVIPLVGVYTPVRGIEYENVDTVEHEDSPESGSTRGVRSVSVAWVHTLRNSGITLVGGMLLYVVAAIVVGLLAAIALHAAVFSILTAIGFIAYGFGADQLLGPRRVFHLSGVLVGLGAVIGMFSVRFFDCFACYTDTGSVGSIRESLRFAVTSPGTFAGYVLASSVVFALPIIPIVALLESRPVIAVPVTLAVMYGCFAFFGSFHAIVFERRVLPAVGPHLSMTARRLRHRRRAVRRVATDTAFPSVRSCPTPSIWC